MPTLNLQLNTKIVVCIEQSWNQFTKLDWYYNADGLYQHIHHETIKVPAFPEAYASFLYSATTLSVGTVWLMERVNALIDSRMRGIFDVVMGETLKGLLSRQIIESPLDEEKRLHLTLSLDGGMDEWWVYAKAVLAMGHLHTREDILNRMWAVNPSIEGWTVVSKGDIYPSLDDDEDTRELDVVGEDDETVPGQFVENNPMIDFAINIASKLKNAKSTPPCVVGSCPTLPKGNFEWYEVWTEDNGWRLYKVHENKDSGAVIRNKQTLYLGLETVINAMRDLVPNKYFWQVITPIGANDGRE